MTADIYVTAGFKSTHENQAYIFMKNEYILGDYADDRILRGPDRIRNVFSVVKCSNFTLVLHKVMLSYIYYNNKLAII